MIGVVEGAWKRIAVVVVGVALCIGIVIVGFIELEGVGFKEKEVGIEY